MGISFSVVLALSGTKPFYEPLKSSQTDNVIGLFFAFGSLPCKAQEALQCKNDLGNVHCMLVLEGPLNFIATSKFTLKLSAPHCCNANRSNAHRKTRASQLISPVLQCKPGKVIAVIAPPVFRHRHLFDMARIAFRPLLAWHPCRSSR